MSSLPRKSLCRRPSSRSSCSEGFANKPCTVQVMGCSGHGRSGASMHAASLQAALLLPLVKDCLLRGLAQALCAHPEPTGWAGIRRPGAAMQAAERQHLCLRALRRGALLRRRLHRAPAGPLLRATCVPHQRPLLQPHDLPLGGNTPCTPQL